MADFSQTPGNPKALRPKIPLDSRAEQESDHVATGASSEVDHTDEFEEEFVLPARPVAPSPCHPLEKVKQRVQAWLSGERIERLIVGFGLSIADADSVAHYDTARSTTPLLLDAEREAVEIPDSVEYFFYFWASHFLETLADQMCDVSSPIFGAEHFAEINSLSATLRDPLAASRWVMRDIMESVLNGLFPSGQYMLRKNFLLNLMNFDFVKHKTGIIHGRLNVALLNNPALFKALTRLANYIMKDSAAAYLAIYPVSRSPILNTETRTLRVSLFNYRHPVEFSDELCESFVRSLLEGLRKPGVDADKVLLATLVELKTWVARVTENQLEPSGEALSLLLLTLLRQLQSPEEDKRLEQALRVQLAADATAIAQDIISISPQRSGDQLKVVRLLKALEGRLLQEALRNGLKCGSIFKTLAGQLWHWPQAWLSLAIAGAGSGALYASFVNASDTEAVDVSLAIVFAVCGFLFGGLRQRLDRNLNSARLSIRYLSQAQARNAESSERQLAYSCLAPSSQSLCPLIVFTIGVGVMAVVFTEVSAAFESLPDDANPNVADFLGITVLGSLFLLAYLSGEAGASLLGLVNSMLHGWHMQPAVRETLSSTELVLFSREGLALVSTRRQPTTGEGDLSIQDDACNSGSKDGASSAVINWRVLDHQHFDTSEEPEV